jgi:hypothetical protein
MLVLQLPGQVRVKPGGHAGSGSHDQGRGAIRAARRCRNICGYISGNGGYAGAANRPSRYVKRPGAKLPPPGPVLLAFEMLVISC